MPKLATAALLLAACPVLFVLSGCDQSNAQNSSGSKKSAGGASRVEVVTVELQDLQKTVEMPGTIEGIEMADLYAKIGGYLLKFAIDDKSGKPIDIGDSVTEGQELAWLDIPEMEKQLNQKNAAISQAEAEIEQAQAVIEKAQADLASSSASSDESKAERAEKKAQLDFRRTEYGRIEGLVADKLVGQELLDQVKFQRDSAEAALKTVDARIRTADANFKAAGAQVRKVQADYKIAEARLEAAAADVEYVKTLMEYAIIKAPFNGIVTKRWVHPGDFIQPAEGNSAAKPLLSVSRIDIVCVFLYVPMNDVQFLDRNDRVVLRRINVLPGKEIPGAVTRFAAALNVNSRMMRVEIDLENPDGLLMPGYYGYVTVYLEEMKDTPVVPSSAVLSDGDESYVIVCENGRAHKRIITTNYQDGTLVGVKSGLKGGEQIVRAGGGQITDGQEVTAVLKQK